MTTPPRGRLAAALLLAMCAACSPLYERSHDIDHRTKLDGFLEAANIDRTDDRTPALIGYGRALDEMLSSNAPVASFAEGVAKAQTCFMVSYGNRAEYRGGPMVKAMIEGREERWREYVRVSTNAATTATAETSCNY